MPRLNCWTLACGVANGVYSGHMRVLIIKTSSLGDVIHTLPAVTDASSINKDLRFDWAVEEAFAEIPAWHPAVETVIPVAIRRWRKQPVESLRGPEWRHCKRQLSRNHYDAVIDAQGLIKSAWLTRYVQAPRWGYDTNSAREPLASMAYHHKVPVSRELHAVERIRQLFASAMRYRLPESTGHYGIDAAQFGAVESQEPSIICLHNTARDEKLWPEEHWRQLVQQAIAEGFRVSLPWGNDAERERAKRIAGVDDRAVVLPRLKLKALAALLVRASGVVAVDTGLGHLAAALGTPAVSLYGPTSPDRVGTYGANQCHLLSPEAGSKSSAAQQMSALSPDLVWNNLRPLMKTAG